MRLLQRHSLSAANMPESSGRQRCISVCEACPGKSASPCQHCGIEASLAFFSHDLLLVLGASCPAIQELGADAASLQNCNPLPDFGGGHPDVSVHCCSTCVALHTCPAVLHASARPLLLPLKLSADVSWHFLQRPLSFSCCCTHTELCCELAASALPPAICLLLPST